MQEEEEEEEQYYEVTVVAAIVGVGVAGTIEIHYANMRPAKR